MVGQAGRVVCSRLSDELDRVVHLFDHDVEVPPGRLALFFDLVPHVLELGLHLCSNVFELGSDVLEFGLHHRAQFVGRHTNGIVASSRKKRARDLSDVSPRVRRICGAGRLGLCLCQ